jgi:hypothetical protein
MEEKISYKLQIDPDITLPQLQEKVETGGKFIVYEYCYSIFFAVCVYRFSPAIFVTNQEEIKKHRKKYNWITAIFGWWSLHGPDRAIKCLRTNRNGIDMTIDIMANLKQEDLNAGHVEFTQVADWFVEPNKTNLKEFKKALKKVMPELSQIDNLVVGYFYQSDHTDDFFAIGLQFKEGKNHLFTNTEDLLNQAFYKRFMKKTRFKYMDLDIENEFSINLQSQGAHLIKNQLPNF